MYDPTIKQYLRCVGYAIKDFQRLCKLLVVVVVKGADPCLDFLGALLDGVNIFLRDRLTCFKDMTAIAAVRAMEALAVPRGRVP